MWLLSGEGGLSKEAQKREFTSLEGEGSLCLIRTSISTTESDISVTQTFSFFFCSAEVENDGVRSEERDRESSSASVWNSKRSCCAARSSCEVDGESECACLRFGEGSVQDEMTKSADKHPDSS